MLDKGHHSHLSSGFCNLGFGHAHLQHVFSLFPLGVCASACIAIFVADTVLHFIAVALLHIPTDILQESGALLFMCCYHLPCHSASPSSDLTCPSAVVWSAYMKQLQIPTHCHLYIAQALNEVTGIVCTAWCDFAKQCLNHF